MTDIPIEQPEIGRVQVNIDVNGVVLPIHWSARRVAQMLTMLLPVLDGHDFSADIEVGPPLSRMVLKAWSSPQDDRAHLESWLLAAMLHELSRGVRASLEEAHVVCQLLALDSKRPYPGDIISEFRRLPAIAHTPALLAFVNQELGGELGFVAEMEALNRGRNCLEHGRGIVRERDCDPGEQVMRLTMPYFALLRRARNGDLVEIEMGVPLPEGPDADGMVQIVLQRRSHLFEFGVGERLQLPESRSKRWFLAATY